MDFMLQIIPYQEYLETLKSMPLSGHGVSKTALNGAMPVVPKNEFLKNQEN